MFERKPSLISEVLTDGHEYVVRLPYHPALAQELKSLGGTYIGGKEHPLSKCWRFPLEVGRALPDAIPALIRACGQAYHETGATLERRLLAAEANPQTGLLLHGVTITLYRYERPSGKENEQEESVERGVIAMAPYHRGFNAFCRRSKAIWSQGLKGWLFRGASPMELTASLMRELAWPADQVKLMEGAYQLQGAYESGGGGTALNWNNAIPYSGPGSQDQETDAVLLPALPVRVAGAISAEEVRSRLATYPLDDYQRTGASHLLATSSALLADDMGLGKSRQAVVAADIARAGGQVVVVCPASLLHNWRNEILAVFPKARISILEYRTDAQWVIVNYEQLGRFLDCSGRFAVGIFDEAHVIKNPQAARTRSAFNFATRLRVRMVLTGTPLLNSISEIHTLLRLSGHPLGAPSFQEFRVKWGASPNTLLQLHAQLDGWMLRREKDDVLTLPGKHREFVPWSLTDEQNEDHRRIMRDRSTQALEKIGQLRVLFEEWKLPYLEQRLRVMGAHDKKIVFCQFQESVERVAAWAESRGLACASVHGGHTPRARQASVDRFQADPDCRVFVGTTAAAGVGLTLTAANHVLFLGLPWTWGMLEQAEDRAYRRGQLRPVRIWAPLIPDSIDTHLHGIITTKRETGATVVKGKILQALAMAA